MTKDEIIDAGVEFTLANNPVCIGGWKFADKMRALNRNGAFEAGAYWVLEQLKNVDKQKLNELAQNTIQYDNGENVLYKTTGLYTEADLDAIFEAGYMARVKEEQV